MFLALPHIAEATVALAHLVVGAGRIGGVRVGGGVTFTSVALANIMDATITFFPVAHLLGST